MHCNQKSMGEVGLRNFVVLSIFSRLRWNWNTSLSLASVSMVTDVESELSAAKSEIFSLKLALNASLENLREAQEEIISLRDCQEHQGPDADVSLAAVVLKEQEHIAMENDLLRKRNADLEAELMSMRATLATSPSRGEVMAYQAELEAFAEASLPKALGMLSPSSSSSSPASYARRQELEENLRAERTKHEAVLSQDTAVIESLEQTVAGVREELEFWKQTCAELAEHVKKNGTERETRGDEGGTGAAGGSSPRPALEDELDRSISIILDEGDITSSHVCFGLEQPSEKIANLFDSLRAKSPQTFVKYSNDQEPFSATSTDTPHSGIMSESNMDEALDEAQRTMDEALFAAAEEITALRSRLDIVQKSRKKWKQKAMEAGGTLTMGKDKVNDTSGETRAKMKEHILRFGYQQGVRDDGSPSKKQSVMDTASPTKKQFSFPKASPGNRPKSWRM